MNVEVTQFLLPNGRQVPITVSVPDNLQSKYRILHDCGARLTAEVLTTGAVSVCVEEPEIGDFDIRVHKNGPEVPAAIADMIDVFDPIAFRAWQQEMTEEESPATTPQ